MTCCKTRLLTSLFTMAIVMTFSTDLFSQRNVFDQLKKVENKVQKQDLLSPFEVINNHEAAYRDIQNTVPSAIFLKLDQTKFADLRNRETDYLRINVPISANESVEAQLYSFQLMKNENGIKTSSGLTHRNSGRYYHGIISGHSSSIVAMSSFEAETIIMMQYKGDQYRLAPLNDQEDIYVFYNLKDVADHNPFDCHTNMRDHMIGSDFIEEERASNPGNCVNMYIEVDYDIFNDKGGLTQTSNYITAVMNEVALLYSNESIEFGVNEMKIWDTNDPYSGPSTSNYLSQFRNAMNGNYNGDLAHLIGYGGGGGIAYVDVLCNSYYGVGYSGINPTYNAVPNYSWTVEVVTHEIGHNLGSEHTHDCAWNGNNTAIDGCGPAAGYSSGCNAPVPDKGTIMSYCHLVSGVGIDFNLGFGPQPGDRIRGFVYNAPCLTSCGEPCTTVGDPCDDGDDCTINDVYDENCNCIGTLQDDDGDGVCNADDICPGFDDNLDSDNDGTADCIECPDGAYLSNNFNPSPLTHSGNGSSTSVVSLPPATQDISFTVSGIGQKTNGKPNRQYIEEVTITYASGGSTHTYGTYSGSNTSSVDVNIAGIATQVTVELSNSMANNTTSQMSVNISSTISCQDADPCPDSDGDGVCDADDICPGGDDNIDTDGDGIPDFCDTDSCPNSTDQFAQNPLTHQGSGSSSTTITFPTETSDVSFDITNIGSKINGNPSNRYIDKVTVEYVDGTGSNQLYGTYLGTNTSSASVSISGIVQSVTVTLEDDYNGNANIGVNFTDVSSCYTAAPLVGTSVKSNGFQIYPNPSHSRAFVNFAGMEGEAIQLIVQDVVGKIIQTQDVTDMENVVIEFENEFGNAIYFISVIDREGNKLTKKLIVLK